MYLNMYMFMFLGPIVFVGGSPPNRNPVELTSDEGTLKLHGICYAFFVRSISQLLPPLHRVRMRRGNHCKVVNAEQVKRHLIRKRCYRSLPGTHRSCLAPELCVRVEMLAVREQRSISSPWGRQTLVRPPLFPATTPAVPVFVETVAKDVGGAQLATLEAEGRFAERAY